MQKSSVVNTRKYCIITCCYLFFTFLTMICFGQLYNVGKYKGYVWILILSFMELLKYLYAGDKLVKIRMKNVFLGAFLIVASIFVFFVTTVLLGADIFEEFEGTLMFSALLSTMTTLPLCLNLGGKFLLDLINRKSYEETALSQNLIQNTCGTFLGSWIGAFVIPLDWDRDWQVWPIPCAIGAFLGYFLSNFITALGFFRFFIYSKRNVGKYKL